MRSRPIFAAHEKLSAKLLLRILDPSLNGQTMRNSGSGSIVETVNHKGHEGTRRKRLRRETFVVLRVLGGSGFCWLHRETDPVPELTLAAATLSPCDS